MVEPVIKVDEPSGFTIDERALFLLLLREQGKVREPNLDKINRCRYLCTINLGGDVVAIGAIKPKTASVFAKNKSGEITRSDDFEWELGYCYTRAAYGGRGYGGSVVGSLHSVVAGINLFATTELRDDNVMVRLLQRAGFSLHGHPWPSTQSDSMLGLFLYYTN